MNAFIIRTLQAYNIYLVDPCLFSFGSCPYFSKFKIRGEDIPLDGFVWLPPTKNAYS
jgi:hypothetical protein